MKIKLYGIIIGIIIVIISTPVIGDNGDPIPDVKNIGYLEKDDVLIDFMASSLEEFGTDLSKNKNLFWKMSVNGAQDSPSEIMLSAHGWIYEYDAQAGILSGPGKLYSGYQAGSDLGLKNLGSVTLEIDVHSKTAYLRSASSSEDYGTYSLTKGPGKEIYYGTGENSVYGNPMCILVLQFLDIDINREDQPDQKTSPDWYPIKIFGPSDTDSINSR